MCCMINYKRPASPDQAKTTPRTTCSFKVPLSALFFYLLHYKFDNATYVSITTTVLNNIDKKLRFYFVNTL